MTVAMIGREVEARLSWSGLTQALLAGHLRAKAEIGDTFLYRGKDTLLTRSAWIDGMGLAVKSATVFPGNPGVGKPVVNGAVNLYSDATGELEAIVDFHLVTKWKTAGDSLLAASLLARPQAREILLVGAGTVARSMVEAYGSLFPRARFAVWSRSGTAVEGAVVVHDLEAAVRAADIICTATMATAPLVRGEWLKPGAHLDLIGAYRPDMREVDDAAMARASVFVDARATTVHHIGEIMAPLASGAIAEADIRADFYDIGAGLYRRNDPKEITIAKNGGGAHLDLMVARYILGVARG